MKDSRASTFTLPFPSRKGKADTGGRVYGVDRWLTRKFLQAVGNPPLRMILWDGKEILGAASKPAVGMVIRDRVTLWRLLINPLLYFGDDYSAGRIEIEGGLVPFMETIYRAMAHTPKFCRSPDPAAYRRNQPKLNSLAGSRQNIHHHYDIGNDFYQLWLDAEILYTCAYFPDPAASLEDAQIAKMELVCRKLRLRAGQTVVEAGCGWGALARHMARRYGVKVRAYNISHPSRSHMRANGPGPKAWRDRSSISRTIIATLLAPMTRSSRWGCWSMWGLTITGNSARLSIAP
jgi:cyclopropane-fatty-acyl-phospholipid synthase